MIDNLSSSDSVVFRTAVSDSRHALRTYIFIFYCSKLYPIQQVAGGVVCLHDHDSAVTEFVHDVSALQLLNRYSGNFVINVKKGLLGPRSVGAL